MKPLMTLALVLLSAITAFAQTVTPVVEYSFEATKVGATAPANTFAVGDEIDVVLYVKDLRPNGTWYGTKYVNGVYITQEWPLIRGVFAAYADFSYNSTLTLEGTYYNTTYRNGVNVEVNSMRFNDTGAFTDVMDGLNTDRWELMRFRFKCARAYSTTLQCNFVTIAHPIYDTLVYGNDAANPPEPSYVDKSQIKSTPLTITVK